MPCGAMLWKLVFSGGIAASEQRHKRRTARLKLFPNLLLYQFISKLFVSHSTLCHLLMTQRSWENLDSNPAGKPSKSPRFPCRFMGEFQGKFLCGYYPPPFPVESKGIYSCGNFPRTSVTIFKMQFNDIGRVPQLCEYILVMIWYHSLVN